MTGTMPVPRCFDVPGFRVNCLAVATGDAAVKSFVRIMAGALPVRLTQRLAPPPGPAASD